MPFHAGALRRMVETGEQIWLYRLHGCGNRILFAFNGSTGVEFWYAAADPIFGILLRGDDFWQPAYTGTGQ